NSYDSSDPKNGVSFGGKYPSNDASICCLGTTRCEGNFMMRGGTLYGKVEPPDTVRRPFGTAAAPVPDGLAPIPPALSPPNSNVTDLRKHPADIAMLKPGDYITDHLESGMLTPRREKGRLRFFIVDSDPPRSCVVDLNCPPLNNNPPA